MSAAIPSPSQPVSMTIGAAVRYSGLVRSTLYKLIGEGKIAAVKVMGRRLILRASLDALIVPTADHTEDVV